MSVVKVRRPFGGSGAKVSRASALSAIGINDSDPAFEGPYFQSQNAARHQEAGLRLLAAGRAYYCDCTREQVAERTGSAQLGYDGFCRDRGLAYETGRALRFRAPDEGSTVVVDLIRGEPAFPNAAKNCRRIATGSASE